MSSKELWLALRRAICMAMSALEPSLRYGVTITVTVRARTGSTQALAA